MYQQNYYTMNLIDKISNPFSKLDKDLWLLVGKIEDSTLMLLYNGFTTNPAFNTPSRIKTEIFFEFKPK